MSISTCQITGLIICIIVKHIWLIFKNLLIIAIVFLCLMWKINTDVLNTILQISPIIGADRSTSLHTCFLLILGIVLPFRICLVSYLYWRRTTNHLVYYVRLLSIQHRNKYMFTVKCSCTTTISRYLFSAAVAMAQERWDNSFLTCF